MAGDCRHCFTPDNAAYVVAKELGRRTLLSSA